MSVNWGSITHIFQLPLRWFQEVDRRSWLITDGVTLEVDRNNPEGTELKINKEGLGIPDKDAGTPDDHSDTNADDDQDGSTWTWTPGNNGLVITPYCEIEEDGGWHYFGKVKLTYSKDGLLVKAEKLAGRKWVKA